MMIGNICIYPTNNLTNLPIISYCTTTNYLYWNDDPIMLRSEKKNKNGHKVS